MALNDFIVHSGYPLEKIIWTYEGIVDNTNPYWNPDFNYGLFIPIPDTLQANNVLVDGVWSFDNFSTSYPINTPSKIKGWYLDGQSYYADMSQVLVSTSMSFLTVDSPIIYVQPDVRSGSPKVRLWAYLLGSDLVSQTDAKTAEDIHYKLVKNTDLAQLNLVSENHLFVPADEEKAIWHNLGFRPFCRIWKRNVQGGWGRNTSRISIVGGAPEYEDIIKITNDAVSIHAIDRYGTQETQEYLVRIYNYAIPQ